jgi:hypothetical protein
LGWDIAQELPLSAFEENIYLSYMRATMLRGGPISLACELTSVHDARSDTSSGLTLLRDAIVSFATTFFGSQHHQENTKIQGYRQYGTVLHQLNVHLGTPALQTANETILTAVTCMILEMFLPTGPNNFLKHMRGVEAILERRGPPKPTDSPHTLLLISGLRVPAIIGGLAMSRTCLFAKEEWRNVRAPDLNEGGLLKYKIYTILADCTRFLDEQNRVLATCDKSLVRVLASDIESAVAKLELIRGEYDDFNQKHMEEPTSSLKSELNVANHECASIFMLYNTARISLLGLLNALEPSSRYVSLRTSAALKIVHCLEYKTFKKANASSEANMIGFIATKLAWQALDGFNSPEGRKLARLVKILATEVFAAGAWEKEPSKEFFASSQHKSKPFDLASPLSLQTDASGPVVKEMDRTSVFGVIVSPAVDTGDVLFVY